MLTISRRSLFSGAAGLLAVSSLMSTNAKAETIGPQTAFAKEPRFKIGQPVRISVRYPLGHYRTPMYIRGKTGTIERVLAEFLDPEQEGYGRNAGSHLRLYRVSFLQKDIWPDYKGSPKDKLQIEMYENWLEEA